MIIKELPVPGDCREKFKFSVLGLSSNVAVLKMHTQEKLSPNVTGNIKIRAVQSL